MRHCPKCAFAQPPDRFCAQCGVDMDQFKPKPAPLAKRIVKNTYVQIALISFFVFLALQNYLKHRSLDDEQIEDAEYYEVTTSEFEVKDDEAVNLKPAASVIAAAESPTPVQQVAQAKAVQRPSIQRLSLTYEYASVESIEELRLQSSVKQQSGDVIYGVIDKAKLISSPIELVRLTSENQQPIDASRVPIFSSAQQKLEAENNFIGLSVKISQQKTEKTYLTMLVTLELKLPVLEDESDEETLQIEAMGIHDLNFKISENQLGYALGFLPRTPPKTASFDFLTQGIFEVFSLDDFMEEQSDVLLFLHPHK